MSQTHSVHPQPSNPSPTPSKNIKPSLSNPDLTGLWSVGRLGHEKKWWSRLVGGSVLLLFSLIWMGGFASPLFIVYLACHRYTKTVIAILSIILYPWLFDVPAIRAVSQFWLLGSHYFDGGASFVVTEPRVPNDVSRPKVITYHPHGIFTLGPVLAGGMRTTAIRDMSMAYREKVVGKEVAKGCIDFVGLAFDALVKAPFFCLFVAKWSGCLFSASKGSMLKKMKEKISLAITPGAFYEVALYQRFDERIVVKKKGFIKYALQNGYGIVPEYTFGESHALSNIPFSILSRKLRMALAEFSLPAIFVWGPLWFLPILSFLPYYDIGVHVFFGPALEFPKIEEPTRDEIDKYHKMYVDSVMDLFETHKWRFGLDDAKLDVVW